MAALVLAVAETADGTLTRLSTEIATLARTLAETAGGSAVGLVVDIDPAPAAADLATYLPRVVSVADPAMADQVPTPHLVAEIVRLIDEGVTHIVLGATTEGRDIAGALVGLTGLGLLANADDAVWADDGPETTSSVLGGKAITRSRLSAPAGIVTLRPGGVTGEPLDAAGQVEARDPAPLGLPSVPVLDRVTEAGSEASLEEARVIVVAGRGVAGPEGMALAGDLAGLLGGVVGATRATVDAGWAPYARQIGQTGRIVKPALYLGLGVSGAMQHRVGMQASDVIVVVNRDPDAPIAEVADLLVVGDLFEIGPALAAELRSRRGG